jgi:hypothetical protein
VDGEQTRTVHLPQATVREKLVEVEKEFGAESAEALGLRGNLAGLYFKTGSFAASVAILEQLLPLAQRLLGENDPQTVEVLGSLSRVLCSCRRCVNLLTRVWVDPFFACGNRDCAGSCCGLVRCMAAL